MLFVLVIGSLGTIFGWHTVRVAREEAIGDLASSAQITARAIDSFLEEHRRAIVALANSIEPGSSPESRLRTFHETYPSFLTLILTDSTGRITAGQPSTTADGRRVSGIDVSDRDYFRAAISEDRPYMSGAFRGRGFGRDPIVALSAPVKRDEATVGVVEGSLNLGSFERFESYIEPSESRSLIVVDSEQRVVYATWNELEPLSSLSDHSVFTERTGARFEVNDPTRGGQIGYSVSTPNGWTIFVAEPKENMDRLIRASVVFTLLWTLAALGMAVLVSRRVAGRVTRPIESLATAARAFVAGGDFSLESGSEKKTPIEIATLVDDFRTMLARLDESRAALEATRDLALEGSRAKTAFLARMSHELRTPLNAILGFGGILEKRLSIVDAELEMQAQKITQSGHQLLGLVEEILEIAQFQPDETRLDIERCVLDEVIRHAVESHRVAVEGKGNRLEVSLDCSEPASIDRKKVDAILGHLLSNANKFTTNGTIRVEARSAEGYLEIVIEDTGVGFEDAQIAQMFDPFWQADESSGRRYGGSGLGLAIVQRYCELMGGTINAKGFRGRGATFTVRLPLTGASEP